jgi:ABC-2 type transport system permease protein
VARVIGAILRAQLLSMRLRGGTRGTSAVVGFLAGGLFYSFWAFIAWTGMLFFSMPDETHYFVPALSAVLMVVMLYWQLAPVMSASFGASLDMKKLLAYPIPHQKLFLVEILLRITTCTEMMLVIIGFMAGLLRNPAYGWRSAPGIVSGGLSFAVVNILLSAGTRNWLERVFLKSKLKEVMMFFFVFATLVPQLLFFVNVRKQQLFALAPTQIAFPWAASGRLMLHDSVAFSLFSASCWVGIAIVFSRWQFERSLRFDGSTAKRVETGPATGAETWSDRMFRLPSRLLPDPFAAIIEKELRTFARVPRFRLVYVMSCSFGILMYMPSLRPGRPHDTYFFRNALPVMTLYGLLLLGQISYWNCFGFDRSATQGYYSWPVRFRDVLIAKNLSAVALVLPQIVIVAVIARAAGMPVSPGKILETVVVMMIASLYWFSLGNIFSVRIPRALDPDKMNQQNKMQGLTIFAAPFLLLPVMLAYWSRWFFESDLVFAGLLLVAAVLGGIFYWVGLDSAAATGYEKREKILHELSRSDGPLSIT